MFTLKVDRCGRLLEAAFCGTFDGADLRNFDAAAETAIATEGPMHMLLDFTGVEAVALPDRLIADHARKPAICPGYRLVCVAPNAELYGLLQVFAAHQALSGSEPPVIVRCKSAAYSHLTG
jgi:hypothetical protein